MIKQIVEAPFKAVGWLFSDTYGRVVGVLLLTFLFCLFDYPIQDTDVGMWEVRDTLKTEYSREGGASDVDNAGKIDRAGVEKREVLKRVELYRTLAWLTMPFHHVAERQVKDLDVMVWEVRDTLKEQYSREGGPSDVDSAGKIDIAAVEKREVVKSVDPDRPVALLSPPLQDVVEQRQVKLIREDWDKTHTRRIKVRHVQFVREVWDKTRTHRIKTRQVIWTSRGLTLGLDLQGGTQLTYRIEAPESGGQQAANAAEVAELIRRRVDAYGLKEPRIQAVGDDRILVQIPGFDASDVGRVESIITRIGRLEFRLVADEGSVAFKEAEKIKPKAPDKWHWYTEVHEDTKTPGKMTTSELLVSDKIELTGENIENVNVGYGGKTGSEIAVHLTFTDPQAFWRVTSQNVGKRLAIVLDDVRDAKGDLVRQGKLHSAPRINEPILGGAEITGGFTLKTGEDLKYVLQSGSLKTPLKFESKESVGPYQGLKAIQDGQKGAIIGFIAVIVFMFIYYRASGLVADVALLLNVVFLIGAMALRGATLTLPGIAGIVLTLGMAVDANVLIFERIREEMAKLTDKSLVKSMRDGHGKALITIVDSNLTTLISAIILYLFGTGSVKGFAWTLSYGLIISMFTSVVVTRILFEALIKAGWFTKMSMAEIVKNPNIPFVATRKLWMTISVICISGSMIYFFVGPGKRFGIEFSAGTMVQVNLDKKLCAEQKVNAEVIRAKLAAVGYKDLEVQEVFGAGGSGAAKSSSSFFIRTPYVPTVNSLGTGRVNSAKYSQLAGGAEVFLSTDRQVNAEDMAKRLAAAGFVKCVVVPESPPPSADKAKVLTYVYAVRNGDTSPDAVRDLESGAKTVFENELVLGDIRLAFEQKGGKSLLVDEGIQVLPAPGGQSKIRIAFEKPATPEAVNAPMKDLGAAAVPDGKLEAGKTGVYLVSGPQNALPKIKEALKGAGLVTLEPFPRTQQIQPAVAAEMGAKAIIAVLLSFLGIIAYTWFRFEFRFGVAGVVALVHDILITVGAMAIAGRQIDMTVIAALLTIIGYSINDTIVIFDRIRENRRIVRKTTLANIIDISVNQTLSRTILTSGTVLLVLVAMLVWGGSAINDFCFAMLVGAISGVYSTIFIASPILLMMGEQGSLRGPLTGVSTTRTVRPLEGFRTTP